RLARSELRRGAAVPGWKEGPSVGGHRDARDVSSAGYRRSAAARRLTLRALLFHQGPDGLAAALILGVPAPLGADRVHDQQTTPAFFGFLNAAGGGRRGTAGVMHPAQQPGSGRGQPPHDPEEPRRRPPGPPPTGYPP